MKDQKNKVPNLSVDYIYDLKFHFETKVSLIQEL